MSWYNEWFGQDYTDVYSHRNVSEAEEFIQTLEQTVTLKKNSVLLDLCCGAGRYAVELARREYSVTGMDLSGHLIKKARLAAGEAGVTVDFHVRDMRDIPYSSHFDGIVNMFTSFGYFREDAENKKVIQAVSRSLKPGGWFVLDFMNKPQILENFSKFDIRRDNGIYLEQYRSYNEETGRIEKKIIFKKNGTVKEYFESVRLFSFEEIKNIFYNNGITLERVFGNYNGDSFDIKSPRMISIGYKL